MARITRAVARRQPLPRVWFFAALAVLAVAVVPAGLLLRSSGREPAGPAPQPVRTNAPEALPACEYTDRRAEHRGYEDWDRTLLDTTFRLTKRYEPPDLVPTTAAGVGTSKTEVRDFMIEDLRALAEAADAAGNPIDITWGYRSFQTQQWVFDYWSERKGDAAFRTAARPGHSEHQLGTALDFRTKGAANVDAGWRYEPAGVWMREHAWEYGFIESYPLAKEAVTCYEHEPWHYRYFGRERAAQIHSSGLTAREFLWREAHL